MTMYIVLLHSTCKLFGMLIQKISIRRMESSQEVIAYNFHLSEQFLPVKEINYSANEYSKRNCMMKLLPVFDIQI